MRRRWWLALGVGAVVVAAAAGCSTFSYYGQAIGGHLEVMHRAEPIPQRIADPATPPDLRAKLERVLAIREFASRELGLPDNGSYRSYADLGRPFVVWNVFAAPEFSVEPRQSCFPIAGCVGYRGYYGQGDAEGFGAGLRKEGFDVFVYGVAAYSTLGWFDDPVLNTFIGYPEAEIARLIFHELAHRVVYVSGDTVFNESFATAVELEGVERWLTMNGAPQQREAFHVAQARKEQFLDLTGRTRERLRWLYAQEMPEHSRRAAKADVLRVMREEYRSLKESWDGFAGFDPWFEKPLNNAKLVSIAAYSDLVPAFRRMLAEKGGDLPAFYAEVKRLARLPKAERAARLASGEPGS